MSQCDNFVHIGDLAQQLTVSISTIRSWVRQGKIPQSTFIKVGATYRYSPSAVIAALRDPEPSTDAPQQLSLDYALGLDLDESY